MPYRSFIVWEPVQAITGSLPGFDPLPVSYCACTSLIALQRWNEALENFARRMPLLEVRLFVAAVVLQSRFGGKLNEILEELAKAIRDAIALRGDVQAISAQGRLTGMILTILPIGIAGVMFVASPAYISVLFNHPYGKYLIAGALVCLALGHLVIQRIVNVKV